jgi:hypothetical protein
VLGVGLDLSCQYVVDDRHVTKTPEFKGRATYTGAWTVERPILAQQQESGSGNHVPPTSVKIPGEDQQLGPHCQNCSNTQGGQLSKWLRELRDKVSPPSKPKETETERGTKS